MTREQIKGVKHSCRYCANCVDTLQCIFWCDELSKEVSNIGRPNKCKSHIFNEIAADWEGDDTKVYKPRKKSPYKQERLFDVPTDKQKGTNK
jgi:hypothetical protein